MLVNLLSENLNSGTAKRPRFGALLASALAASGLMLMSCYADEERDGTETETTHSGERTTSFAVRGWGSVYLQPEPGELEILIEKQDLNRFHGADILVARLLAPDRELVAEAVIPDDGNAGRGGGPGPIQRTVLRAEIDQPGLYKLDLEARTGHEPGHDIVWGIETNAPLYMIESLVSFMAPEPEGEVWFRPPEQDFAIEVRGIGSNQVVRLRDDRETERAAFDLNEAPEVSRTIPGSGERRPRPWGLILEQQRASISIEGVTEPRDSAERQYPEVTYWTPHREAFFDADDHRWMLYPYRVLLFPEAREQLTVPFTVRNGTTVPAAFAVRAGNPAGVEVRGLPEEPLRLEPGETAEIELALLLEGELPAGKKLAIRVTVANKNAPALSTFSTVYLSGGSSPVARPLEMPLVQEPYRHENEQFGYFPDYIPNVPYFDRDNRPHIRQRGTHRHHTTGVEVLEDDGWRHVDFTQALRKAVPDFDHSWFASYRLANKVAFDSDNDSYTLVSAARKGDSGFTRRQAVLLHAAEGDEAFQGYPIGDIADATFEIEQFTGHNEDERPPPILLYKRTEDHPARFAWFNDLLLYLPGKTADGGFDPGDPIKLTGNALNPAAHSGGGSPLVTRGNRTFIAWGEAVPPETDVPGVPTYVAVYDHDSNELSEPFLLGYAPPANDSHNSPAITVDSKGYLHVVIGAHGRAFQYSRSKEPLSVDGGWTDPEPILSTGRIQVGTDAPERGAQTYVGLVCGPDDTLHVVSRQWREGVDDYHDGHLYAALSHQRKRPGEPWEEPELLVVPPLPDYSVYYHKLSIDRKGALYLAYNYYSTHEHYRKDSPGLLNHQAVLTSPDGGKTWKLAETADFHEGVEK